MPKIYPVDGCTYHGVTLVRRCADTRYVIARCTHPECANTFVVPFVELRRNRARKLCDEHFAAMRRKGWDTRKAITQARLSQSAPPPIIDSIQELVHGAGSFADDDAVWNGVAGVAARSTACRRAGVRNVGYAMNGRMVGLRMAYSRTGMSQRQIGQPRVASKNKYWAAQWECVCLLCGKFTVHWDSTLTDWRSKGVQAVRHCDCMGWGKNNRLAAAREAWLTADRLGVDVGEPLDILRLSVILNHRWGREANVKWAYRMHQTIKEILATEPTVQRSWLDAQQHGGTLQMPDGVVEQMLDDDRAAIAALDTFGQRTQEDNEAQAVEQDIFALTPLSVEESALPEKVVEPESKTKINAWDTLFGEDDESR